ncbi:pentatricopeptide repeat-containing protein At2g20540-like [Nymphaea colorata]|uniref:pentatricopeptide repeat-containing protein At2g20540-like n=1 Tax=Nymphaea colorata TaxID=210225 RepID=UPI00129E817B|nr:pentatricopeptide repeat-containing protein At2g20540-like [Nymphaea colorata]
MPSVFPPCPRRNLTTNVRRETLSRLQASKSIGELKQIHAHVVRQEADRDVFVATKLLESVVVAGHLDYGHRLFDCIELPNAYTWTTMIRGFVEAKCYGKAVELYYRMRSVGVPPNNFTFLFMLKTYSFMGSCHEGRIIHGKIFRNGLDCDDYLHNALVSLYAKCGELESAQKLFEEMPQRNLATWNAMLNGYFIYGDVKVAQKLFDEMPERNVVSWNTMLGGYSRSGMLDLARSLFEVMPKKDLLSWSTMISGYIQSGQASEALELFHKMQLAGVGPDAVTMASVLSACAQIGALDTGKWVHAYVERKKLRHDVVLSTSLIDMYAKCGLIDMALQVFNTMQHRNLYSWNALICGLAMHGMGHEALEFFGHMGKSCIMPNQITFVGVLCACCHVGCVEEARRQFRCMTEHFDIDPTIEHYGCMVDVLGRAGLIDMAKEVIEEMPMQPNIVVWGALLAACKIHGNMKVGAAVVKHLMELAPSEGGCYVLVSNIYAAGRRWDEAAKMRKAMREMGVEKTPGCSCIEVNSVVHEFVVHDQSHPQWEQIIELLDELNIHLEEEGYLPDPSLLLYDIAEEI